MLLLLLYRCCCCCCCYCLCLPSSSLLLLLLLLLQLLLLVLLAHFPLEKKNPSFRASDNLHGPPLRTRAGTPQIKVVSEDLRSGRHTVNMYDMRNKLVAFHVLLPQGQAVKRITCQVGLTLPTIE